MLERSEPTVDAQGIKPKGLKSNISQSRRLSLLRDLLLVLRFLLLTVVEMTRI